MASIVAGATDSSQLKLFGSKTEVVFAYSDGAVTTHERIRVANLDYGKKTEFGDANRKVMEPYTKKYRVGRIEGLHHYLFTQDSIKTVVTTWMRYIESGYFD